MLLINIKPKLVTVKLFGNLALLLLIAVATLAGCRNDLDCPAVSIESIQLNLEDADGTVIMAEGFTYEYRLEPDGVWKACEYGGGGPSDQCGYDEAGTFSVRAYDDTRFGMQTGIRVSVGECNVRTQDVTLTVSEGSVPE